MTEQSPANPTRRALVVDDSLTIRMDLGEGLQGAGFDTVLCPDLRSAREALAAGPCALLVLDVLLPDGSGLDLLSALRSVPGVVPPPVLLLAHEAEVGERLRAQGLTVEAFIGKPYDLDALVAQARALTGPRPAAEPVVPGPRRRVLVIDDSATYRQHMREALEDAGHEVHEAETGEDALAVVGMLRPDAIVVDGVLPGIDGRTVVRRLKADTALRSTPCLLLTAAEDTDDELRSLEAGADAYVRKSEALGLLLARLSALLRHAPARVTGPITSLLGPKRLLAVDDSTTYLQALGDQLREEGYDVVLATSGEEALERLAVESIDCILLDLIMPGLSGEDTCRCIKQSPAWRDIPLVMLTARDDRAAMIEGINAGADDYIAKSADFGVLKARLRAQLRRKHFEDENRRIREQLVRRETEARFQRLLHSNIIGVLFGDLEGRVTDANDAFLGMLGYTRADLNAGLLRAEVLTPPAWRRRDLQVLARLRTTGSAPPAETELLRKDGARLPVVLGRVLLEDSETTVGFVLDRTEQKQAEEKIRTYMHALEDANRELALARDQAEQSSRFKSGFLANMSHELRTPLNAIIGFAELLYDGHVSPDLPEHREFLGDILTSGRHLLQLINDILDLSKVEAGKLEFHPEPVDLESIVAEVLGILRTVAAGKRIRITTELDPALKALQIDPARLKQVLYNFLSNALKFTPQGGLIAVRGLADDVGAFRLEVEDNGVGITAEDAGRLFTEFLQLDSGAAKKHGGTGLGLALTKKLVEAQGGTVGVQSTPGAGSCFHAVLPRIARRGSPLPGPRIVPAAPGAPVVLVVEDNEADQARLVRTLTRAGYCVETAATGAQAMARCRERPYDAIALDLLLPDVTGLDVLRAIRASGLNRDAPVVVITVVTEPAAVAGFPVHEVMQKPFDETALLASLRRAGLRPVRAESVLVVDDDPGSAKLLTAVLQQQGLQAVCVPHAADGLQAAATSPPLAVVLDLLMPGMDGFAFLEAFRALPGCATVPVVVWTSKDVSDAEYLRLANSALAVLQKGRDAAGAVIDEVRAAMEAGQRSEV